MIKSAASAASPRGGRANGRLDHGFFVQFLGARAPKKIQKKYQNLGLCPCLLAVREFANKSAASAASPDSVKFQAVIKPAASAASRKPKIKETKIQGSAPFRRPTVPRRPAVPVVPPSPVVRALPWILVSLILGFLEAALAADLITA